MDFNLHYFGHNIVENAPFSIIRPEGSFRYIFFHFVTSCTIKLNDKLYTIAPGNCILYEPGIPQHFFVTNHRLNHDYLDFVVDNSNIFKSLKFPLNTIINPRMSREISNSIKYIENEYNSEKIGSQLAISNIISSLFINIARKINPQSSKSSQYYESELIKKFENLRLEMFQQPENLNVKKLAEKLNFSAPYFSQLYKKYFNTSPIEDLTEARINLTKTLLINGETIKVISKKLGFVNVEYFYRWFRKHFKMTPKNFAENYKKENL